MDREGYITDFISHYISCYQSSTGTSPEISVADYISLRKQAVSEYMAQARISKKLPDYDDHRDMTAQKPHTQQKPSHPVQDLAPAQQETYQENDEEDVSPAAPAAEADELAILRGLGED